MRATINANISESIGGIAVAKSFRQEHTLYETFQQVNRQAYRVGLKRGLVMENMFPAIDSLRAVSIALILYAGGASAIQGEISPGTWYLFIQAFELFLHPFIMIASFWSQFQNGLSAAERVFALLDVEPRVIQHGTEPVEGRLSGQIAFRNVSFADRACRGDAGLCGAHRGRQIEPGATDRPFLRVPGRADPGRRPGYPHL